VHHVNHHFSSDAVHPEHLPSSFTLDTFDTSTGINNTNLHCPIAYIRCYLRTQQQQQQHSSIAVS
jgi:hypothetical protein